MHPRWRDHPRLVLREHRRWEVRCPDCQRSQDGARPIGIGIPIVNRFEAEGVVRNHAGTIPRGRRKTRTRPRTPLPLGGMRGRRGGRVAGIGLPGGRCDHVAVRLVVTFAARIVPDYQPTPTACARVGRPLSFHYWLKLRSRCWSSRYRVLDRIVQKTTRDVVELGFDIFGRCGWPQ
jgi:hypothetical protein